MGLRGLLGWGVGVEGMSRDGRWGQVGGMGG